MEQRKHLTWKEALAQSYRSVEDISKVMRLTEAEKSKMADIIKVSDVRYSLLFSLIYADEKTALSSEWQFPTSTNLPRAESRYQR